MQLESISLLTNYFLWLCFMNPNSANTGSICIHSFIVVLNLLFKRQIESNTDRSVCVFCWKEHVRRQNADCISIMDHWSLCNYSLSLSTHLSDHVLLLV